MTPALLLTGQLETHNKRVRFKLSNS